MTATAVFQTATIDSLRHQLGDSGPGLLGELIGLYLLQAQDLVGQIEDAVTSDDPPRRRSLAHKLRGSTATLGGVRLAAACLRLETVPDVVRADPDGSAELTAAATELREEFAALAVELGDYRRSLRAAPVGETG